MVPLAGVPTDYMVREFGLKAVSPLPILRCFMLCCARETPLS
jgi:hypothetical protein